MSKFKFNYTQLLSAASAISILRDYPQLSWDKANQLNAARFPINALIKTHAEEAEFLDGRGAEIFKLKEKDEAAFMAAVPDHNSAVLSLSKKIYELSIDKVPVALFNDVQIDGYKEVPQQHGSVSKFSYRDAYFELLELGIIA
jgi:hypothetical protein